MPGTPRGASAPQGLTRGTRRRYPGDISLIYRRPATDFGALARAVRYVARHRPLMVLAYGSLLVATAAQLLVPQLVRVIS